MLVYLLHFERPLGRAQHYVGSTPEHNLARRMQEHANGRGAKLTAAVARAGIPMTLARLWYAPDRRMEREVKAKKAHRAQCPICTRGETGNPVLTPTLEMTCIPAFRGACWNAPA